MKIKKCSIENCLGSYVSYSNKFSNYYCAIHLQQMKLHNEIRRVDTNQKNIYVKKDGFWEVKIYTHDNSNNNFFLIDEEDKVKIHDYRWWLNSNGYVSTTINSKQITLHNYLIDGMVDHINRNRLDNRKKNLRLTNKQKNSWNRSLAINNTSGFTGIWFNTSTQKWVAEIKKDNKKISLGRFVNKEDAIKKRLEAEKELFEDYAPQKHLFKEYGIE